MDKVSNIKQLLSRGKTTREIAKELRVSLRDIHTVRKQQGIDIGALDREKKRKENEIGGLESIVIQKRHEVSQLQKQVTTLLQQKQELEAAIERKKTEIKYVQQPIEPIYLPVNHEELKQYIDTLSYEQLQSLKDLLLDAFEDIVARGLRDERNRIEQQTRDNIRRILNNR